MMTEATADGRRQTAGSRLVDHHFATRSAQLPLVDESLLLDYVVAAEGTYARGRRPGLEACIPIGSARVRGLREVAPYVQWGYPKVPARMLALIFQVSQTIAEKEPREALFHLSFDATASPARTVVLSSGGWHLEFPPQQSTAERVEARYKGAGTSEESAVIEVHSHHEMDPDFSPTDDVDEGTMSFRLYGVIGNIFTDPSIRMRVGLFGHFYEYPASEFFEMPEGVRDAI